MVRKKFVFSRSRRFSTAHERSTQSFFCSRWIKFNQTLIFIVSNCVSPLRTISKKQAEKKLRFHIRFVSGQSQQVRILVFIEGIDIGCNSSSICNRNHGLSHCFFFSSLNVEVQTDSIQIYPQRIFEQSKSNQCEMCDEEALGHLLFEPELLYHIYHLKMLIWRKNAFKNANAFQNCQNCEQILILFMVYAYKNRLRTVMNIIFFAHTI